MQVDCLGGMGRMGLTCCIDENGKNDFKYMCYEESFEISHYRIGTKALNQYCEDPEI